MSLYEEQQPGEMRLSLEEQCASHLNALFDRRGGTVKGAELIEFIDYWGGLIGPDNVRSINATGQTTGISYHASSPEAKKDAVERRTGVKLEILRLIDRGIIPVFVTGAIGGAEDDHHAEAIANAKRQLMVEHGLLPSELGPILKEAAEVYGVMQEALRINLLTKIISRLQGLRINQVDTMANRELAKKALDTLDVLRAVECGSAEPLGFELEQTDLFEMMTVAVAPVGKKPSKRRVRRLVAAANSQRGPLEQGVSLEEEFEKLSMAILNDAKGQEWIKLRQIESKN